MKYLDDAKIMVRDIHKKEYTIISFVCYTPYSSELFLSA